MRSFSSQVSFSSAMIFSVSWGHKAGRDQDNLGQAPTGAHTTPGIPPSSLTLALENYTPVCPQTLIAGPLQLPTCSLSMASSGPIWGSALGENDGSSSPLCVGGDEGEAGTEGDAIAGRAPPGLPSSTFRPGRERDVKGGGKG